MNEATPHSSPRTADTQADESLVQTSGSEDPPLDRTTAATKTSSGGAVPHYHRLQPPVRPQVALFESSEHKFLGDHTHLQFPAGAVKAGSRQLAAGRDKHLTYGQILALGGDFYGLPNEPISSSKDALRTFELAYWTLAEAPLAETNRILEIMEEEIKAVKAAREAGKPPSSVYDALGDTLSYEWNVATGGHFGIDPTGRYLALAAKNWDHFGSGAITSYKAGHQIAMVRAATIKSHPDPDRTNEQKLADLELAYAVNAFADHFLTDLFSAGHLRTPRKALYDRSLPIGAVGSLLARCMHDEDSKYGLTVHNSRGDTWTSFGDKRLLDDGDASNLTRVEEAVQISADEVWQAYENGRAPTKMGALELVPDLARVRDPKSRENFSPLFVYMDGAVQCRNSLADRSDYSWTTWWMPATTLAELKTLGWISHWIT